MHIDKTPFGVDIVSFSKPEETTGSLCGEVLEGLTSAPNGFRCLPTMLLYDDRGLDLYEKITTDVKEYYLFQTELDLLNEHSDDIARTMFDGADEAPMNGKQAPHAPRDGKEQLTKVDGKWGDYESGSHNYGVNGQMDGRAPSQIVELGAGSLSKTSVLLRSLAKFSGDANKPLTYYAVDLEHSQLVSTLDSLLSAEKSSVTNVEASNTTNKVLIKGARASYEEFLPQLSPKSDHGAFEQHSRKILLWLGSSLGNFTREEAAEVLKRYVDEGLQPGDRFLIGIDSTMDGPKIELAYGEPAKITETFILNGLDHLARLLEQNACRTDLDASKFDYVHRFNEEEGCHEAYVRAKCDLHITPPAGPAVTIAKDEMLLIERSFKYSALDIVKLFDRAGLRLVKDWKHAKEAYGLYLVEKPAFYFPSSQVALEKGLNPFGLPSMEDWKRLWAAFDCVTLDMIPPSMLHTKPIDLRHICLFYIGHIPTFCQIHLSKALDEPYTHPANYTLIFERGIDPNMDDPTQCHDHSIVPEKEEDWPKLHEILAYRDRVRDRMTDLYESGRLDKINGENRRLARAIAMVYEHEAFHLETLLYMLLQKSESINPPPHFATPDWQDLARKWNEQVAQEGDRRTTPLVFDAQQITMGIDDKDSEDLATPYKADHVFGWDNENGVRTVEVAPFKISPTPVSNLQYHDFLKKQGFAAELVPSSWFPKAAADFGIRVPYKPGYVGFEIGQHWPVFASAKQLAAYAATRGGRLPTEPEIRVYHSRFPVDAPGSNVGFRNWHPIPASLGFEDRGKLYGSHNGGAWEWTSSTFEAYEGFSSSLLYPGYSSDFFDGTHSVILGGSWATPPRLAGRPSVRNWFQRAYEHTFSTARIAWDA